MPSFKVPCPSCEHQVLIKNPNLVGTKVECPKCKYRFKVEEPADGAAAGESKPEKGKKKAAAETGGTGKKKSKKTVAIGLGVLAVVVLVVVGYSVMGGGDGGKKKGGPVGKVNPIPVQPNPEDPKIDPKIDPKKPEPPPKPSLALSDKETTNLLPNDAVAFYRIDVDSLRRTPAALLFDQAMVGMFGTSMGFDADQVAVYYHTFVGPTRDPFGVIRLKDAVAEPDVVKQAASVVGHKKVKGRNLFAFKSNPFVAGVANTFALGSLFGDVYDKVPPAPVPAPPRVMGFCVYDTQHVLVGDHARIERFLNELDPKGYPKFLSLPGSPPPGVTAAFSENSLYLSIDPKLKRLLKDLRAETGTPPPVVYAERVDARVYDPKLFKPDFQLLTAALDPVLNRTQYAGANLTTFTTKQLVANARLVTATETVAFEVVKDYLRPGLPLIAPVVGALIRTPVEFRDLTSGATDPKMGMTDPKADPKPDPSQVAGPSYLSLGQTDQTISLAVELNWSDEVYRQALAPRLVGLANTLKGKMAVFASDASFHAVANALTPLTGAGGKGAGRFPRGTGDRKLTDVDRMGLKYPPHTRTSFFVDMLPYMGRGSLYKTINPDLAWFDDKNLPAAESWVPELLVPTYPQSAWRATSPYVADGRVLGGTNYVGIAGRGLDVARYNPEDEEQVKADPDGRKKVGLLGYDWGSKTADVTDGMSNTIFLMQTPPGVAHPWMAGGGATLRGLNEADPMHGFRHDHGGGRVGTYALMGDGSVRFVPGNIDKKVLLAMSTRAGGIEEMADAMKIEKEAPRFNLPKRKDEAELKPEPPPKPVDPEDTSKKPTDPKTPEVPKKPTPGPKVEVAPEPRPK